MPLEAWAIAGGLYIVLVAVARAVAPARSALGFAKTITDTLIASDAVIDIASVAEGRATPTPTVLPAHGS